MLDPRHIWASSQLPTLPAVAIGLLDLAKDPETEIRDVIELVKSDPAISAKLVKAANSTFFGFRSEVRSVDRAVPLLGTTVTTSLSLSFSLSDDSMAAGPMAAHYNKYWQQSVVQASAAETLCRLIGHGLVSEYFLVGLLLDLGRLAMLKVVPREYRVPLEAFDSNGKTLAETEREHLGIDHVEVGVQLMTNWKLPESLVRAVATHHASASDIVAEQNDSDRALAAAAAVAAGVGDYFCNPSKGRALERLKVLTHEFFQLDEAGLTRFLDSVGDRLVAASDLFNVDLSHIPSTADLMVEANEQLVNLTLREHVASTQATVRQQVMERERQQLEDLNRELAQQAMHDGLTKVYNRKFFDETLDREVVRGRRSASPVGVILIDVDRFKLINDTYGHPFGDVVLQQIARALAGTIRGADIISRYGGEEFVVLANQPTEKGLEKLAERLRERIEQETFLFGATRIPVTVSVGASITIPARNETDSKTRLVAAADECLYRSKSNGRNRVTVRSLVSDADREMFALVNQQRFSRWLVARQYIDVPQISRALVQCQADHCRIGELAVRAGYLSEPQVTAILEAQTTSGERFGQIAVETGVLSQEHVVHLLALQQETPQQLAAAIARLGLMSPSTIMIALEEYQKARVPQPSVLAETR
jgi:diguanylate cyclase (GGDEF)-like protein